MWDSKDEEIDRDTGHEVVDAAPLAQQRVTEMTTSSMEIDLCETSAGVKWLLFKDHLTCNC